MSNYNAITTGEQSVTATGAITGSLDTSALSKTGTIKIRVSNLSAGQSIRIAVEDTANASAFSEATTVAVFDFGFGVSPDGNEVGAPIVTLPSIRFGATNTKLRLNATAVGGSPTAKVVGWIAQ